MHRSLLLAALALLAVGLSPSRGVAASEHAARPRLSGHAKHGLAFARKRCSVCHAVTPNGTSPNPESPPFEDIANRPGVTADTLVGFLRDSHNFPAAMNFHVSARHIRDLSAYIATLRKDGYRPVM